MDYAIDDLQNGDWRARHGYERSPGDDGWILLKPPFPFRGYGTIAPPQHYTSSLDAAMAWVERWFPSAVYTLRRSPDAPCFSIQIFVQGMRPVYAEHDNRELAIVLCVILAEIERCVAGAVT